MEIEFTIVSVGSIYNVFNHSTIRVLVVFQKPIIISVLGGFWVLLFPLF